MGLNRGLLALEVRGPLAAVERLLLAVPAEVSDANRLRFLRLLGCLVLLIERFLGTFGCSFGMSIFVCM